MQAELNDFYERREVHQRTPRKFNEIKGEVGEEILYDRFQMEKQSCPKTMVNEDTFQEREKVLHALE